MAPCPADRVGYFIRTVEPLYRDEKPVSFDPVQMSFLQALVRQDLLQAGLTIAKEDFFQGIAYLDYFTEVVAGRSTLLQDVAVIVEELERMHEYLDPTLDLLVRYSGLFILKDLKGERFFQGASPRQVARRHERAQRLVSWPQDPGADLDLFSRAVGRMVCDMVQTDEAAARLGVFQGSSDLRAALACDCLLQTLEPGEVDEEARQALSGGELLEANLALLRCLVRSCEGWSLRSHVERLKARLEQGEGRGG